jgi:hypothetical protein
MLSLHAVNTIMGTTTAITTFIEQILIEAEDLCVRLNS